MGETACENPFKGSDRGWTLVEKLREKMTSEDIKAFGVYVDERCRKAYEEKKKWFVDIALSKTNQGRDQLYIYVANWLASWLMKRPK